MHFSSKCGESHAQERYDTDFAGESTVGLDDCAKRVASPFTENALAATGSIFCGHDPT